MQAECSRSALLLTLLRWYQILDLVKPSVIAELFFVVYVYNLMFNNIVRHNNQEQANRKDRPQRTLHLSGLEFYRTDNGAGRERDKGINKAKGIPE